MDFGSFHYNTIAKVQICNGTSWISNLCLSINSPGYSENFDVSLIKIGWAVFEKSGFENSFFMWQHVSVTIVTDQTFLNPSWVLTGGPLKIYLPPYFWGQGIQILRLEWPKMYRKAWNNWFKIFSSGWLPGAISRCRA